MRSTTLVLAITLLALGATLLPVDHSPVGTAEAQSCTQQLMHGADAYLDCEKNRCQYDPKRPNFMMCYD